MATHAPRVIEFVEVLRERVDDEPCHYDHHGYCQAHNVENPCSVAVGRALLAQFDSASGPHPEDVEAAEGVVNPYEDSTCGRWENQDMHRAWEEGRRAQKHIERTARMRAS